MEREPVIQFKNCTKLFGSKTVLHNISFQVNEENSFITIIGKSGSGKTTLLRLVAGLEKLNDGRIYINGTFTDAAYMMGATPFYIFRKISLPLMGEALFTSFFIILIFCLNELSTVIMIYPPGTLLLPITIFTRTANAPQHIVSGMSLVALLFTIVILLCMFLGKKMLFNQQWRESR